eukprot:jgi/Bigna1/86537/estExt_fgenesh1_pg.C_110141
MQMAVGGFVWLGENSLKLSGTLTWKRGVRRCSAASSRNEPSSMRHSVMVIGFSFLATGISRCASPAQGPLWDTLIVHFEAEASGTMIALASMLFLAFSPIAQAFSLENLPGLQHIKHVVLLMEENRSFDHMCGFFPGVNGLSGNESNPYNTSDPNSKRVPVGKTSPYIGPFDPNHNTPSTTEKIFGDAGIKEGCKVAKMDGFVEYEAKKHSDPTSVINMFTPERLPVMKALADNFLLFDRFFCSHPGPTWPNRLFQLMATSKGNTETTKWHPDTLLYFGETIFHKIEKAGLDWRFYYADAPLEMAMIAKLTFSPLKIHGWRRFMHDIETGSLPSFSWVNPRWFVNKTSNEGANDQHPDHDVRLGEGLLKEIYEALRASPAWNETLFIVDYDEHGGFYDHVPTPLGVPAPDDSKSFPDSFDFTRLGIRIPALLISPWVAKGKVVSEPSEACKPFPNSEFDLTSILSTVKKIFNLDGFLTKRDAWAATFEDQLSEPEPRTDCPETLPEAPKSLGREHTMREAAQPLNHLQKDILSAFATLTGRNLDTIPKLQGEGSEWVAAAVKDVLQGKHVYADMLKDNKHLSAESTADDEGEGYIS